MVLAAQVDILIDLSIQPTVLPATNSVHFAHVVNQKIVDRMSSSGLDSQPRSLFLETLTLLNAEADQLTGTPPP